MSKDDLALLYYAVMCADWGIQMPREQLKECYKIIENETKETI